MDECNNHESTIYYCFHTQVHNDFKGAGDFTRVPGNSSKCFIMIHLELAPRATEIETTHAALPGTGSTRIPKSPNLARTSSPKLSFDLILFAFPHSGPRFHKVLAVDRYTAQTFGVQVESNAL